MADKKNGETGNGTAQPTGNATLDTGTTAIGGIPVVEPGTGNTGGNGTAESGIKRGRGRPAGSGNKSKSTSRGEKASPTSIAGIEKILYSVHQMAAGFIVPELELSKPEAKDLAEGIADVGSFYNQVVDPKIVAWVGLIGVCGKLYGPRFGAWRIRKMLEKEKGPRASVTQIRPTPTSAATAQSTQQTVTADDLISLPQQE